MCMPSFLLGQFIPYYLLMSFGIPEFCLLFPYFYSIANAFSQVLTGFLSCFCSLSVSIEHMRLFVCMCVRVHVYMCVCVPEIVAK